MPDHHGRRSSIAGALLGGAVGDALGLPYEGLSRRRGARMLGQPDRYRFFPGRGMVSDDTEHACMVAQSLAEAGEDVADFSRRLAWRLRWWLLLLPAGTGFATLRAVAKLWLGFSPVSSGVFSAGNGPAMRAPVLGAAIEDRDLLQRMVRASTRMTHSDPKAEFGAWAVALAAWMASRDKEVKPAAFAQELEASLDAAEAGEFLALVQKAVTSVEQQQTTAEFASSLGLEKAVSGYIYHTAPVVLHAWLSHQADVQAAITSVIKCGGDADSTAAIVGGICGAAAGEEGIPAKLLEGIWEWPRSVHWMKQLSAAVAESAGSASPVAPPKAPFYKVLPRNVLFLAVVLFHGFRRLAPPY